MEASPAFTTLVPYSPTSAIPFTNHFPCSNGPDLQLIGLLLDFLRWW